MHFSDQLQCILASVKCSEERTLQVKAGNRSSRGSCDAQGSRVVLS